LPADFQTAEYLLKYGQVDMVSHRKDLKNTIEKLIRIHALASKDSMYNEKSRQPVESAR
jgi:acetyl-CoA carboxylase carboxyl transferase subunit beta